MNSVLGSGLQYNVTITHPNGDVEDFTDFNLLPQEGVNHISGLIRGSAAPIANWYVGVFENNYVPTSAITAADLQTIVGESVAYDETLRPTWVNTYDNVSLISNAASKAVFTFNATKRIYGAFIVSASGKGGNTGLLLSIARFTTARDLDAGAVLSITAGLTLVPSA